MDVFGTDIVLLDMGAGWTHAELEQQVAVQSPRTKAVDVFGTDIVLLDMGAGWTHAELE